MKNVLSTAVSTLNKIGEDVFHDSLQKYNQWSKEWFASQYENKEEFVSASAAALNEIGENFLHDHIEKHNIWSRAMFQV